MNRRFIVDKHKRIRNRKDEKRDKAILYSFRKPDEPYSVKYWRKTKKTENTRIFYVSFSVENDSTEVISLIKKHFDGLVLKVFNWESWYEVHLNQSMTWGEIVERVDKAFLGNFA